MKLKSCALILFTIFMIGAWSSSDASESNSNDNYKKRIEQAEQKMRRIRESTDCLMTCFNLNALCTSTCSFANSLSNDKIEFNKCIYECKLENQQCEADCSR